MKYWTITRLKLINSKQDSDDNPNENFPWFTFATG